MLEQVQKMIARKTLKKLEEACKSKTPFTDVAKVLGMDVELYQTSQDFQDAVVVRVADLMKDAGYA